MTEHTPETFNLADWLVGGTDHRPTRSVTVYLNQNLQAQIDALNARIEAEKGLPRDAQGNPEESLGGTSASTLEDQRAALLAEMLKAKAEVVVYPLIDNEINEVDEAGHKSQSVAWWYEVLARAGTLQGNRLTAEQWGKLHETIGPQFGTIISAYRSVAQYETVPSAPFSPPASQRVTGR